MANHEDRWKLLCSKYEELNSKGHELYFRMGRFAIQLSKEVAKSCGCSEDSVFLYEYTLGNYPGEDSFSKASSGFDAVSEQEKGWVFGIGVCLEIGPNTFPKTTFVFPVIVNISENMDLSVETGMTDEAASVTAGSYSSDMTKIAEMIFDGLCIFLDRSISGERHQKQIGFITS